MTSDLAPTDSRDEDWLGLTPPSSRGVAPVSLAVVIVLATILVVVWFHPMLTLGGGEQGAPFLRPDVMGRWSWWAWSDSRVGGVFPTLPPAGPFWGSMWLLWKTGIPPWLLQALVFWIAMVVAGAAVASLARWHSPEGSTAPLIAAFAYLLGPFTIINVWHRFILTHVLMLAYLPFSLALLRRAYGDRHWRPVVFFLLVTPWFGLVFATPGFVITLWIALAADALWMRVRLGRGARVLSKFALALACWVAVGAYWIVPLLWSGGALQETAGSSESVVVSLKGVSSYLRLPNSLLGVNGFVTESFALGGLYRSPVFLAILFAMPIVAFGALLRRRGQGTVYLAAAAILGLFLMKGAAPPGGGLFVRAVERLPLLGALRNPYERLGFLYHLPMSLLLGAAVAGLYLARPDTRWLSRARAVPAVALGALLVIGWPVISGSVFSTPQWGTYRLEVPEAYRGIEKASFDSGEPGSRVLVVPVTAEGISYAWPTGYRGVDIVPALAPSSVSMITGTQVSPELAEALREFPATDRSAAVPRLLGARHIVVRRDVLPSPDNLIDPRFAERRLSQHAEYELVREWERISMYRITGCVYPRVYASASVRALDAPTFGDLASAADDGCETVVAPSAGARGLADRAEGAAPVSLRFRRLSPTSFVVSLPDGFTGWVVFNEAWHKDWRLRRIVRDPACPFASVTCLMRTSHPVAGVEGPVVANSFANAWSVTRWPGGDVLLVFTPQMRHEIGAMLSLLTMAGLGSAGLVAAIRRQRRGRSVHGPSETSG